MDSNQIAQHPEVKGQQYADKLGERTLNQAELALINKIKAKGADLEALLLEVNELIAARTTQYGTPDGEHYRNAALGKTNLQQGYMWLIRAVAAPNGLV